MGENDLSKVKRGTISAIYDSQLRLEQSQKRMETALFGDEEAGIEGMIREHKKHKEYIAKDKTFKGAVAIVLAGIAMFSKQIGDWIVNVYK